MSDNVMIKSFVPQTITAITKGAFDGILETGIRVKAQARALAPVDTGQLKGSIGIKTVERNEVDLSTDVKSNELIVGTPVEHGIYQEFGTRNQPAQPFMRPAVDIVTNGESGENAMKKAMENTVKQVPR